MISEDLERIDSHGTVQCRIIQAEHVAASIMRAIRAEFEGRSIYIDRQCSARVAERNRIIARAIADNASIDRLASRFGVTARLIRMIRAQYRQGRITPWENFLIVSNRFLYHIRHEQHAASSYVFPDITVDETSGLPTGFSGIAYSGGVVPNYGWYGDSAIDIGSLSIPDQMFALVNRSRSARRTLPSLDQKGRYSCSWTVLSNDCRRKSVAGEFMEKRHGSYQ